MDEMQEYIHKRIMESGITNPTLEEIRVFFSEWIEIMESRLLSDFEGYSGEEIKSVLYNLFGEGCPVQLLTDFTDEDCNRVPLFRQAKILLELIEKEEKIKLTQTGNLPPRIVKEMYSVGASDYFIRVGIKKLRTETDSISVQFARIIVQLMGVVKKRNNHLLLTKKGKTLLTDNKKIVTELMIAAHTKFNLAYFDGYDAEVIGGFGIGLSLILLHKYGDKVLKDTFYAEKYFKAFPELNELSTSAMSCYSHRVFNILMFNLGLVTVDEKEKFGLHHSQKIYRTDLLEKLFRILPPQKKLSK